MDTHVLSGADAELWGHRQQYIVLLQPLGVFYVCVRCGARWCVLPGSQQCPFYPQGRAEQQPGPIALG